MATQLKRKAGSESRGTQDFAASREWRSADGGRTALVILSFLEAVKLATRGAMTRRAHLANGVACFNFYAGRSCGRSCLRLALRRRFRAGLGGSRWGPTGRYTRSRSGTAGLVAADGADTGPDWKVTVDDVVAFIQAYATGPWSVGV